MCSGAGNGLSSDILDEQELNELVPKRKYG